MKTVSTLLAICNNLMVVVEQSINSALQEDSCNGFSPYIYEWERFLLMSESI